MNTIKGIINAKQDGDKLLLRQVNAWLWDTFSQITNNTVLFIIKKLYMLNNLWTTISLHQHFLHWPKKSHDGHISATWQQQQPFYGPLSGTTRVRWYQKKYSPTHHPDHHPIFISFFHLPRSIASSLFKLRAWQSFCTTSLHVLFGVPLAGALHLIFHTLLHAVSVFFSQHVPIPSQPVLL